MKLPIGLITKLLSPSKTMQPAQGRHLRVPMKASQIGGPSFTQIIMGSTTDCWLDAT